VQISDLPADEDPLDTTESLLNSIEDAVRRAAHDPALRAELIAGFERGFGMQHALLSEAPGGPSRAAVAAMLADFGATLRANGQEAAFLGYTLVSIKLELYDYPPDHPQAERIAIMQRHVADVVGLVGREVEEARSEVIKDIALNRPGFVGNCIQLEP